MIEFIEYKEAKIRYETKGSGQVVVLLHGYLESIEIWQEFGDDLATFFSVIAIDLPGHGESESFANIITMDAMADAVAHCLEYLNVTDCIMIGHSMGGYVTCAFAEKYPKILKGFCLFHSTPFADNDEKKTNRNREIGLVLQGKKELIYNINIPRVFADDNLEKLHQKVSFGIEIAKKTSDQGIIAALEGMKQRPDRQHVFEKTDLPVLFIIGEKDNYIPVNAMDQVIEKTKNKQVVYLRDSGHLGFIEEKNESLSAIIKFYKNI
jgi:pimeloyl-ACP methyl ester carboxylesterase